MGIPTRGQTTAALERGPAPPHGPPPEPPPSRELWPWLLVLVILVVAGLAAAWFATRDSRGNSAGGPLTTVRTVTTAPARTAPKHTKAARARRLAVPSLVGMKAADALTALRHAHLQGTMQSVASSDPPGTVSAQDPHAGSRVTRGSTVTLKVSKGQQVAVPGLTGQRKDDAVKALQALGLKPDLAQVPSSDPKDTIVDQHPSAGTKVATGTGVLLNVSAGTHHAPAKAPKPAKPAATPIAVPGVVGENVGAARAAIRGAGLVTEIQHVPSSQPKDTVVAQSPKAGTTAKQGDHVLINLSLGPAKHPQAATSAAVPDVRGEDQATATADLQNAGFTVSASFRTTSDQTQDGIVVDQSPAGGTRKPANSNVTIYVGRYNGG
jgi:eukaryotic-like serine/threonine-protein kinase